MNIGFVGLGKLGLPCALAVEANGHKVFGCDINPNVKTILETKKLPYREVGAQEYLNNTNITFCSTEEVVKNSEIIFVPIQTPHIEKYEGITRIPTDRVDFDYTYLKNGIQQLSTILDEQGQDKIVIIISTVIPGTVERELKPILSKHLKLCYNPFFIAMGTTIQDFVNPEFVLFGVDDHEAAMKAKEFYSTIHNRPFYETSIKNAELIKVSYNTFIGMKIVFANVLMEICHKIGADVDAVTNALKMGTDRLISKKYLSGGMGDGGGCFPASARVMTKDGFKLINDIKVGDLVLTHTGKLKPVVKIWERNYNGKLTFIKTKGTIGEWMTHDHPVITATNKQKGKLNIVSKTEEVFAQNVLTSHLIPWPKFTGKTIQKPKYATDSYIELAGWWLSEGSGELNSRRGRLCFTLNSKELEYSKQIEMLLADCAVKGKTNHGNNAKISNTIIESKNTRNVRLGNHELTKRLVSDFGIGSANKKLPDWVLYGNKKTISLILKGILLGDGGYYQNRITFDVISQQLAEGVFFLLNRLGYCPTMSIKKAHGIHKQSWVIRIGCRDKVKELASLLNYNFEITNCNNVNTYIEQDNSIYRLVTNIKTKQYIGKVYNLWVKDDNTFVTLIGAVHNCHPRDNIALSWFAKKLNLSFDWFDNLMMAREKQTDWLADLMEQYELPKVILGKAFKEETNLTVGSPSILLKNILNERGHEVIMYDPHVDTEIPKWEKSVFFIGTKHNEFKNFKFPKGSIVLDPWRYIEDQDDVTVIRIGQTPSV